jgi:hypothetical protein
MRCLDESGLAGFYIDAEIAPGRLAGQSLNERLGSLLHVVATEGRTRAVVRPFSNRSVSASSPARKTTSAEP